LTLRGTDHSVATTIVSHRLMIGVGAWKLEVFSVVDLLLAHVPVPCLA